MEKYLQVQKRGVFYESYGDDAYILWYLLGYKIRKDKIRYKDKIGFPENSLNKVIDICQTKRIFLEVKDYNSSYSYDDYLNQYENVLQKANEKYKIFLIKEVLNTLHDKELLQVASYVTDEFGINFEEN